MCGPGWGETDREKERGGLLISHLSGSGSLHFAVCFHPGRHSPHNSPRERPRRSDYYLHILYEAAEAQRAEVMSLWSRLERRVCVRPLRPKMSGL